MEWAKVYVNQQVYNAIRELRGATARAVAERARTTRITAEKHLRRLVDMGIIKRYKIHTGKKGYIWAYILEG